MDFECSVLATQKNNQQEEFSIGGNPKIYKYSLILYNKNADSYSDSTGKDIEKFLPHRLLRIRLNLFFLFLCLIVELHEYYFF